MPDFNVRADSVNVEQIMEQIRARIREKRGVDYTEQQIRELAAVKLERFLDPSGVRSDLLDQFRKVQPPYSPPELPNYAFEESTLYESHRSLLRIARRLLNPILKLFFNPNPLIQALNIQSRLNTMSAEREATREAARRASDQLFYELIHNLVIETTRMSIEVKNLKMRVESLSSRLEFNERRARALESAVVYRTADESPVRRQSSASVPSSPAPASTPSGSGTSPAAASSESAPRGDQVPAGSGGTPVSEGPGQRSRRRRRRRGRRGRGPASAIMGAPPTGEPDTDSGRESEVGEGPAHDDLETIGGADSHPAEPLRQAQGEPVRQAQGEPLREAQGGTPPDREPHEE